RVTASVNLNSADITTALGYTPGSGGGTVGSVTSAATSGNPITVSASSTSPSIDISRATASVNGYLASSDFTTFNNKVSSQWVTNGSGDISRSSGNVGIGTTAPAYALSVSGDVNVTGNFKVNGVNFTGSFWSLSGNAGTAAGTNFVGTTDNNDVVLKRNNVQAGLLNDALLNTSWGVNALNPVTTGWNNTATGHSSIRLNTSGSRNTANGNYSLNVNTTGSDNTAIGYGAMIANNGGISNTSLGASSLYSNMNGSINVAIGANSMSSNTSGGFNTATGFSALYSNSTGGNNTATGQAALGALTTGSNNSALGYQVGLTNLISGSHNILIGTSGAVDTPAAATSNFLNIGNTIFATGVGTGTLAAPAGNVGIGTTTPAYKMDVIGDVNVSGNFKINGVNIASGTGSVTGVTAASTAGNPITVSASSTSPSVDISRATASVNGYLASSDFTTFNNKLNANQSAIESALGYVPVASGLTSSYIFVGNASNIAVGVQLSGDATVSNTGILSLSNTGVGAGTFSKLTVDLKGRVTASGVLNSSDITTALGYTPGSGSGTVGSVSSAATSGNPITVSASSTSPSIDISRATASVNGYLASSDFTTFSNKLNANQTAIEAALGYVPVASGLTSSYIFVGNASNIAVGTQLSGDATVSNTGLLSLATLGVASSGTKVSFDTKGRVTGTSALASGDIPVLDTSKVITGVFSTARLGTGSADTTKFLRGDGSWQAVGGGTVGSVTSAATSGNPITVSASSTSPSIDITKATASVNGYLASSDFTIFAAKLSNFSTLTSADVTTALSFIPLRPSNNLSEITNAATARSSLGLGTSAVLSVASSGDAGVIEVVKGSDSRLTNSRAPSGTASGDLTGTYPDPVLKNIVVAGTGSKITYDAKGRVTASVNLNSADITTALGYTPGTGSSQWNTSGSDISYTTGSVGVGTTTPATSSLLDISSTTKGFLPPRMTAIQRTAIATPAAGLIVYDTTDSSLYIYKNSAWAKMSDTSEVSFRARLTADQGLAAGTVTLINWDTKNFDIGNSFNLATDRFKPTVAGRYFIVLNNYADGLTVASDSYLQHYVFKNGVSSSFNFTRTTSSNSVAITTYMTEMNGTTDYLEFFAYCSNACTLAATAPIEGNYVQGFLIGGGGGGIPALTNGSIFVGNSSNAAAAVTLSGDATISNLGIITFNNSSTARSNLGLGTSAALNVPAAGDAGVSEVVKGSDSRLTNSRAPAGTASGDLTGTYPSPVLANIVTAGTGTKITFDAKGRVTASTNINSNDVTTALGYTPAISGSGVLSALSDVSVGSVSTGQVLGWNGTSWVPYQVQIADMAIAQNVGTLIGDMISGGGLAAAFDGNTNQDYLTGASTSVAGGLGAVGKDWGSGVAKRVTKLLASGSTDYGFSAGSGNVTLTLQGSSNGSSWTTLYSSTFGNFVGTKTVTSSDGINVSTAYRYHRVTIQDVSGTGYYPKFSEIQLFEPGGVSAEALWSGSGGNTYRASGSVGIGTTTPSSKLTVTGTIESTAGGVKFPDGTTQTSAATSGLAAYGMAYTDSSAVISAAPTWGAVTMVTGDVGLNNVSHSTVTNPQRMTVSVSGTYMITYKMNWNNGTGSAMTTYTKMTLNGSTMIAGSYAQVSLSTGFVGTNTSSTIVNLVANDYVQLEAQQNFGSPSYSSANLMIQRLGP
ncbi:MAG: hypothetical protein H7328_11565, partial [Bdellovibrio sp.]|nr:hypothetical protein [Bdellovibrio sp.]